MLLHSPEAAQGEGEGGGPGEGGRPASRYRYPWARVPSEYGGGFVSEMCRIKSKLTVCYGDCSHSRWFRYRRHVPRQRNSSHCQSRSRSPTSQPWSFVALDRIETSSCAIQQIEFFKSFLRFARWYVHLMKNPLRHCDHRLHYDLP